LGGRETGEIDGRWSSAAAWVGAAIDVALYVVSRIFSPEEDRILAKAFPEQYLAYRKRLLIPWL